MKEKYKELTDEQALLCIANELAEMNRLKRLQLYYGSIESREMEAFDVGKERKHDSMGEIINDE